MNDMNRIEPQIVNNAVSNIELALSALSSNYQAIDDVSKTIRNLEKVNVLEQTACIQDNKITEYFVLLEITFSIDDNIRNEKCNII